MKYVDDIPFGVPYYVPVCYGNGSPQPGPSCTTHIRWSNVQCQGPEMVKLGLAFSTKEEAIAASWRMQGEASVWKT